MFCINGKLYKLFFECLFEFLFEGVDPSRTSVAIQVLFQDLVTTFIVTDDLF